MKTTSKAKIYYDVGIWKVIFMNSNSYCTEGEARTPDTWFWRPVLYQLSYFRFLTLYQVKGVQR